MVAAAAPILLAAVGILSPSRPPSLSQLSSRQAAASTTLPLRIDGNWYDLTEWADEHPGGRWLLEYARGRDVTALFHAIHMKNDQKASAALSRLPTLEASALPLPSKPCPFPTEQAEQGTLQGEYVLAGLYGTAPPEEPPLPPINSALRDDLRAMLRREFPTPASSKASAAHWVRTILALVGTLGCWAGWAQGSALACLLLPFVHWVLIAHTVHEATHGNLHTDPRINFWAQFTSHPICFNVFVWIPQHLLSHHQYTNDYLHDVDCHHFAPALISDAQPKFYAKPPEPGKKAFNEGWTFVWKGFLTTLGTSILQPLRSLTEKPTPNYDVNVTPVPAAVSKRALWLSVLPSLLVLLYPLVVWVPQAPLLGLWLLAWPWVGMSLIFTTMTQVSHVQKLTQPSQADSPCWTSRQIHASLDYSLGEGTSMAEKQLVTALAAGLNAQSLHHAMPTLSCAHFPRVYAEYASICERHGVAIRQSENVGTAVREMLEYVFENNEPQRA